MKKENIARFKKYVAQQNIMKKPEIVSLYNKEGKSVEVCFEKAERSKIKFLTEATLKEISRKASSEKLVGLEISLAGRIKGAAMARRTTTGLSGSLKPQTILGSEYYSIYQKNVYTK